MAQADQRSTKMIGDGLAAMAQFQPQLSQRPWLLAVQAIVGSHNPVLSPRQARYLGMECFSHLLNHKTGQYRRTRARLVLPIPDGLLLLRFFSLSQIHRPPYPAGDSNTGIGREGDASFWVKT
jgi:hypothetical protein